MKRFALAGGLLVAAFAGVLTAQDKALKELEGTYKVTFMEKVGRISEKETNESLKITIKGDELTVVITEKDGEKKEKKAKIKVETAKTPNTIDIVPSDGPEKGKTFPGIYKIEKGEVTVVFTEKGDRPKDFKVEGDAVLIRLKKDEKK
jgi:uncharacterized protein (TIGR03067 family)